MNAKNNFKIMEKIVDLKDLHSQNYVKNSFLKVQIKEGKDVLKTFLAIKKKQTHYLRDNKKIIHELTAKNRNKWVIKTIEIEKIKEKYMKIPEKELLYIIEKDKNNSRLIREFYITKTRTVYTLPDKTKIITQIFVEDDKMTFELIEEK